MKSTIIVCTGIITLFSTTLFFAHVAAAATRSSTNSSSSSYGGGSYGGGGYGGGDRAIIEKDCRLCHEDLPRFPGLKNTNPDKHHFLLGKEIAQPTIAPYVTGGYKYECLSCHNIERTVVTGYQTSVIRDCLQCHPIKTVSGSPGAENVHHKLSSYRCSNCHTQMR
ncbi:MAG: hypothetical protein KKB91_04830 [Proteobacteria bacterium]|jgi:hypothetical protein|nr:hypothetical protein [Desulfocapsa sp.]MBU3943529.1 hypothetical protein [Pseudomonadota bacterium]MCG2743419.1 hypothetical protein [Desulfobacteraceae bacterium]MBU3983964.1 hypothetical protein [Pseudomonadota bacterium]MBU4028892.1 hypothetical protein [Pseudomonadota bacterium]